MRGALNIIVRGMPSVIKVGGIPYEARTGFRVGIECERILDDPELRDNEAHAMVIAQHFDGLTMPPPGQVLWAAVSEFHAASEFALFDALKASRMPSSKGRGRTFDWDYDAHLVIADFQREYGIDLTDPSLEMHWWRFMDLFRGLSDASRTRGVMAERGAKVPDKAPAEVRRSIETARQAAALPPRTEAEAIEQEKERYGIG